MKIKMLMAFVALLLFLLLRQTTQLLFYDR